MEERRAELAKMRSLLFYQEQKQKRVAKIKSKTYRKIANKAAQKNAPSLQELHALDPERAKEEQDRLDFERTKERMTLKHKNSGKWAKRMLGRYEDAGSETHKALMQQLQKGEQLRKKIDGVDSDDSYGSDNDDAPLLHAMTELNELNNEIEKDIEPKDNGLFGMKFMHNGLKRQKVEAMNAVMELQREIGGEEAEDGTKVETRRVFAKAAAKSQKNTTATSEDYSEELVVKASGPVAVKPLFQVESFEEIEFKEDAPKTLASFGAITSLKENEGITTSWIDESKVATVKKSIASTHKQFERNSKTQKSLFKLGNDKRKIVEAENMEDSGEVLLSKLPIESGNAENFTELVHANDINDFSHQDIMRMTFSNDDIAKVLFFLL